MSKNFSPPFRRIIRKKSSVLMQHPVTPTRLIPVVRYTNKSNIDGTEVFKLRLKRKAEQLEKINDIMNDPIKIFRTPIHKLSGMRSCSPTRARQKAQAIEHQDDMLVTFRNESFLKETKSNKKFVFPHEIFSRKRSYSRNSIYSNPKISIL